MPAAISLTRELAVRAATSTANAFPVFSCSRPFFEILATCSRWRSGATVSIAVNVLCRVNSTPSWCSARSPTTNHTRVFFFAFSAFSSLTSCKSVVVLTWVPQHKFLSSPSISLTRISVVTLSGNPRQRMVGNSGSSGAIHLGVTASPARILAFTACSSSDNCSGVKPVPSNSRNESSVPRFHASVCSPKSLIAVAVMTCCPECCCI